MFFVWFDIRRLLSWRDLRWVVGSYRLQEYILRGCFLESMLIFQSRALHEVIVKCAYLIPFFCESRKRNSLTSIVIEHSSTALKREPPTRLSVRFYVRDGLFIHRNSLRALWASEKPLRASLEFELVIDLVSGLGCEFRLRFRRRFFDTILFKERIEDVLSVLR